MNKIRYDTHIQKNGIQKRDPDNYKFYKYKNNIPNDNVDFVSKDKIGFDMNALIKKSADEQTIFRSQSHNNINNNNKDNIYNDQQFNISGTKNRNRGHIGSKYMVRDMSIDQEQNQVMDKENNFIKIKK